MQEVANHEKQRFVKTRRIRNQLKALWHTPHRLMGWVFLIILSYLIVVPLVEIAMSSVRVQESDLRRIGGSIGDWTSFYWKRALNSEYSQKIFYEPLFHTAVVSIGYTILAMLIGVSLAWLVVRTDIPGKKLMWSIAIIPYILPSWTYALVWIGIFGSDQWGGGVPGFVQNTLGVVPPRWLAYGPIPIMIVLAINYFVFTYLMAATAFSTMDSSLEEAAIIHGASRWVIIRKIVLPMILPALGSAFILTVAQGIGTFGVPAFLGAPVRYYVLSTSLYQFIKANRMGDAFVIALFLILVASSTIYANHLVLGKRRDFSTIGGKGSRSRPISLGIWRIPIAIVVWVFLIGTSVLPVGLLIAQSLQIKPGVYALDNYTLQFWVGKEGAMRGILVDPRVHSAIWNSLRLALGVSVIATIVGMLISYTIVKGKGTRLSRIIEQLSLLPYLIPGIAFGAIYLTMWAEPRGPLPALYGTFYLMLLAGIVNRLPFSVRSGVTAMSQMGAPLEEAAEVHGAGFVTRLRRVLFPLSKNGIVSGFVLSFISTIKDLSLVVLLVTPGMMLLTTITLSYVETGLQQYADAIAVLMVFLVLGITGLAKWVTKIDPVTGFGGDSQ